MKIKWLVLAALLCSLTRSRADWTQFLDGSTIPGAPWQIFQDGSPEERGETTIVDFVDPVGGAQNQAIRISSGTGANEFYFGPFELDEVAAGARFRVIDVSSIGKENLVCVTVRSKHLAPCPALTLVNGRFKLWNYVGADTELFDIGPVDLNVFHTIYLYARADGLVKCWWDGKLIFDGMAPLENPFDGYVEWGGGSWQYDARQTTDYDWFGYGDASVLPLAVSTTPPHGQIFSDPLEGFKATIVSQEGAPGVAANGITMTVNGVDRTTDLVVTGSNTNREVAFNKLTTNQVYKIVLTVKDVNGTNSVYPLEFDTFGAGTFTFEAEDFNFDGGGFLDSIVLSSIEGPDNYLNRVGVDDIDQRELSTEPGTAAHAYRTFSLVGTEKTRDYLRQSYELAQLGDPLVSDFNVGSVDATEWLNYTRTYPSGTFNVYARLASGTIGEPFTANLAKVTNATLQTQTTTSLGAFKGAAGRGWQTYDYVPLTDAQGKLVKVTLNGTNTFRVTAVTPFNANFYLLAPAAIELPTLRISRVGTQLVISWDGAGFNLESSDRPDGGFATVMGFTNPYQFTPGLTRAFYRLKQ